MNALRVSGFNPKLVNTTLIHELFTQGGPVTNISLVKKPEYHAIVRFQHEESVPYCLALFDGIELFGDPIRLNPLRYNKDTNSFLKYLKNVRSILRDQFATLPPPNLPPKIYPPNVQNRQIFENNNNSRRRKKGPKKSKKSKKIKKQNKSTRQDKTKTSSINKESNRRSKGKRNTASKAKIVKPPNRRK